MTSEPRHYPSAGHAEFAITEVESLDVAIRRASSLIDAFLGRYAGPSPVLALTFHAELSFDSQSLGAPVLFDVKFFAELAP